MNNLHHPCEHWAERISLAAAGCLSTDEEREVRRHIETCSDCSERLRQLTELCGVLAEARLPAFGTEAAIVQRVMSVVASADSERPVVRSQAEMIHPTPLTRSLTKWRWIMCSQVSRVAAAVVFVLIITGVVFWFHSSGTPLAFADFVAPILKAKTVKYKTITEMKGPPAITIRGEEMILDATRSRHETQALNTPMSVQITDWSQGKSLNLIPAMKQATILKYSNTENVNSDFSTWFHMLQTAQDNKDKSFQCESLGEKKIDGRRVVGFRISGDRGVIDLWGDPKTGMPVCVEMTMGIDGNIKSTWSDFVFNVDMDESLFSIEPPAGYTVWYENVDDSKNEDEEKDLIEMLREYTKLTDGAFPDALDLWNTPQIYWTKANNRLGWERIASKKWKTNEEMRHRYEELMLKIVEEKPNAEQMQKIQKSIAKLIFEMMWEDIAPEKLKANEEVRQKFMEQMLEAADMQILASGKELNEEQQRIKTEEQGRKIEEEIRKIGGDEMLKAMEDYKAREAQSQKTAEDEEALEAQFMEAQRRVQRGLDFANQLPQDANTHYAGKGVSLGTADTPIFWYLPKDSKKYRVIYADLSVHDADTPPSVPNAQPVPGPTSPKK